MFGFFKNFGGVSQDIGIDLGTASVLVYVKGKGIVIEEPSVVAIDTNTDQLLAVGTAAQRMIGRTPCNIEAIRPLREGVISDFHMTEVMLKYFLAKVCKNRVVKPRIIVCVPSGVTDVEARAVRDAALQAGASKTRLIEEPMAAAIGAGLDISQPCGRLVVDIGGGTCDIAVISLGGIVNSVSIKVAGDKFDDAIIKYVRKRYNVLIGETTAEKIKCSVGTVFDDGDLFNIANSIEAKGRSLITGLPKSFTISSSDLIDVLTESAMEIVEAVKIMIEDTPPELVGDISSNGIVMTGGGSLLKGLDKLLTKETGIECRVADNAISCVAIGTGKALDHIEHLRDDYSNQSYYPR